MKIGIIGCGFVADFYLMTLPNYPELIIAGVTDRDKERAHRCGTYFKVPVYENTAALLADPSTELIVNLTNPDQHYLVSKAILEAGKSVYSEKPLAMKFEEAEELVRLAERRGVHITAAPCSVMSEAAQTVWKALRQNVIGKVYLVYGELDGGLTHRLEYKNWLSPSGLPFPYKDEFETGCTIEHAGYYVTWLAAFFGPAQSVTSFASCLVTDKKTDEPLDVLTPDFSVGCIEFASGTVARITNSIVAPRDHSFRFFGEEGILSVEDGWMYGTRIHVTKKLPPDYSLMAKMRRKLRSKPIPSTVAEELPLVRKADYPHRYEGGTSHQMDFARGVADVARAIRGKKEPYLSARFGENGNRFHCENNFLIVEKRSWGLTSPIALGYPKRLNLKMLEWR
jgi:predicted dehydrogenase